MKHTHNLPPLWWLNPWKAARRLSVTLDHVRSERDFALGDLTEAREARAEDDRQLHDILSKKLPTEVASSSTRSLAHLLNLHAQRVIKPAKAKRKPSKR